MCGCNFPADWEDRIKTEAQAELDLVKELLQDSARCVYCGSTGDLDTNCRNCGAPLTEEV